MWIDAGLGFQPGALQFTWEGRAAAAGQPALPTGGHVCSAVAQPRARQGEVGSKARTWLRPGGRGVPGSSGSSGPRPHPQLAPAALGRVTPQRQKASGAGARRGARQEKHLTGGCEIKQPGGVISRPPVTAFPAALLLFRRSGQSPAPPPGWAAPASGQLAPSRCPGEGRAVATWARIEGRVPSVRHPAGLTPVPHGCTGTLHFGPCPAHPQLTARPSAEQGAPGHGAGSDPDLPACQTHASVLPVIRRSLS